MQRLSSLLRSPFSFLFAGSSTEDRVAAYVIREHARGRGLAEILDDRYGRRSTIVTSQLPVDQWHALIGDPTYADAVLDRLVHNAHRIDLNGESMRRTRKPGRKA